MQLRVASAAMAAAGVSGATTCSAAAYTSHIKTLASSIAPRVLLPMRGSGNHGESGTAEFYAIDTMPSVLETMPPTTPNKLERRDIDLGPNRLVFTIDNVLSPDEADALASCAESVLEFNGHSRLAPGIMTPPGMRVNEAAHWYPSYGSNFLSALFQRFQHLVPQTMDDMPLYGGLSEKVAQFKYGDGDHFNRHIDGLFPGQGANAKGDGVDEWTGVVSGMSILFYLNDGPTDGLVGGETRVWSADGSRYETVTPKKGRALFFRRGSSKAVLHAGLPVTGEVPKYMALINLAYGKQTGTKPMRS